MMILLGFLLCLLSGAPRVKSPPAAFGMTGGTLLIDYPPPRIALAGDADGDGKADFLGVYQPDGVVDFSRMSPLGKLQPNVQARTGLGHHVVAAACGRFTGERGAETLVVLADGSVRLAWDMRPGTHAYAQAALVASLPAARIPKAPVQAVTADFDGDGRPDVLLAGADGQLILLANRTQDRSLPRFTPLGFARPLAFRRLAGGDLSGTGRAELVWSDAQGGIFRARLARVGNDGVGLAAIRPVTAANPGDGLVAGHFRGRRADDLIVGQRLLPGGDPARAIPLPNLPDAKQARDDAAWMAADLDGNGQDDLIRARRTSDLTAGGPVYVHYAYFGDEIDNAPFGDADNDGLLNAWETGKIKPGGMDLPSLGCSPRHRDALVEIQPYAGVDVGTVRAGIEKAVHYFASLPILNPDGARGIALHPIYHEPLPASDNGRDWRELFARYHAPDHMGITHWMGIYNGGGGQSDILAQGGNCGLGGLTATFLHEFGHQLGLDHSGRWHADGCPIYPSLMNYPYNYQRNGNGEQIGYSDGRLAGLTLNERHLSERLPLAMEKLTFLAGPPYHFRMKPTADGKGTLIDWNWNGVFGEEDVAADINYGYSTTAGERHPLGKTYSAPALASLGEGHAGRLMTFSTRLPTGALLPASTVEATGNSVGPNLPGRLCLRLWQGSDAHREGGRWSEEREVEPQGVIGEASAASFAGAIQVAYPTLKGVLMRRITLEPGGAVQVGSPTLIPGSGSAQPTLAPLAGRLALLLWRDRTTPVGLRLLAAAGDLLTMRPEVSLDFTANGPVGAAEGAGGAIGQDLWIGLMQNQPGRFPGRWQVRRFTLMNRVLQQVEREWVGGETGGERGKGRVSLIWEANRAFGDRGQLFMIARGGTDTPIDQDFIAMRIADTGVNGGWQTRRYYDEWTNSRTAPSACLFRGDIVLANRWFGNVHGDENDNLLVSFFGRGLEDEPMGDFDDIGFIRDYGLPRSLPLVSSEK